MKKYEMLELEVESGSDSDVITTSAEITTEEIFWPTTAENRNYNK